MINLIAAVYNYKHQLAIGYNNQLLFKLTHDHLFFQNITTYSLSNTSKLSLNVLLMGRKCFLSLPKKLPGRIHFVLTNSAFLLSKIPKNKNNEFIIKDDIYFINLDTFRLIYKQLNPNVFIIGGGEIYNLFLNAEKNNLPVPKKLYITHVQGILKTIPNVFMDHINFRYRLIGYSEKYTQDSFTYRILFYKFSNILETSVYQEFKYLDLLKHVVNTGNKRDDRTGTGTISTFGNQLRFDISETIPLFTTKFVPFRIIVEELLWMCRGDTDAKILQKKGIHIWDGNSSREFLDARGLMNYPNGVLGPIYGFNWRHFGADYHPEYADTNKYNSDDIGGFDQLQYVENLLKNDPFSRRIIISAWAPNRLHEMALPPCHTLIQFYVTEEYDQKFLSCMFTMRSSDFDTASCYNCTAYSILTCILAKKYNMKPKELVYNAGDTHVYLNHLDAVNIQLSKIPCPLPKIILNDSITTKDWKDITIDDFELVGYLSHKPIPIKMAI